MNNIETITPANDTPIYGLPRSWRRASTRKLQEWRELAETLGLLETLDAVDDELSGRDVRL